MLFCVSCQDGLCNSENNYLLLIKSTFWSCLLEYLLDLHIIVLIWLLPIIHLKFMALILLLLVCTDAGHRDHICLSFRAAPWLHTTGQHSAMPTSRKQTAKRTAPSACAQSSTASWNRLPTICKRNALPWMWRSKREWMRWRTPKTNWSSISTRFVMRRCRWKFGSWIEIA